MARPKKSGLDYFPHEVNASNDEKIEALEAIYPMVGYSFFFKLLERIYKKGGKLDCNERSIYESSIKGCATGNRDNFECMMKDACEIGLFDLTEWQNRIITSNEIKRRYNEVLKYRTKDRQRKKISKDIPDIIRMENNNNPSENSWKRGEIKVNKRKLKDLNTIPASPGSADAGLDSQKKIVVNKNNYFLLNEKKISFSIYYAICRKIGGSQYDTDRIFFRSRKAENPIAYILHGLDTKTILNPSLEEDTDPGFVQTWINENIRKHIDEFEAQQCQK